MAIAIVSRWPRRPQWKGGMEVVIAIEQGERIEGENVKDARVKLIGGLPVDMWQDDNAIQWSTGRKW